MYYFADIFECPAVNYEKLIHFPSDSLKVNCQENVNFSPNIDRNDGQ